MSDRGGLEQRIRNATFTIVITGTKIFFAATVTATGIATVMITVAATVKQYVAGLRYCYRYSYIYCQHRHCHFYYRCRTNTVTVAIAGTGKGTGTCTVPDTVLDTVPDTVTDIVADTVTVNVNVTILVPGTQSIHLHGLVLLYHGGEEVEEHVVRYHHGLVYLESGEGALRVGAVEFTRVAKMSGGLGVVGAVHLVAQVPIDVGISIRAEGSERRAAAEGRVEVGGRVIGMDMGG